jgi:hypothetical protein
MHLGTLGELTCIHMETSIFIPYLSCLVMLSCCPITKGVATEPSVGAEYGPDNNQ